MVVTRWTRETLSCRTPGKKVNEGRMHGKLCIPDCFVSELDASGRDKWMLRPQLEGYFITFGCWYFVARKKYWVLRPY